MSTSSNGRQRSAFEHLLAWMRSCCLGAGLLIAWAGPVLLIMPEMALADDDDDDDDDRIRVRPSIRLSAPRRQAPRATPRPAVEFVVLDPQRRASAVLQRAGFQVVSRSALTSLEADLLRVRGPRGIGASTAERRLRRLLQGAAVSRNQLYRPSSTTCASCASFDLIGWVSEAGHCAAKLPVAIIDTRVDLSHPALAGQNIDVVNLRSTGRQPSSTDHGTAVASLLVGRSDSPVPGLIPGGRLIAVDAFHRGPQGDAADAFDLIRAVDQAIIKGAKVLNMSFAGPENEVFGTAVKAAQDRGAILVASVGNDGPRARPAYPAAYPEVIGVTAVDPRLRAYRRAGQGLHVAIAAPGVGVMTARAAGSGVQARSGTSYATPFITAIIAAALSEEQDATDRAREMLFSTAQDLGAPGRDPVFGFGLANAAHLCRDHLGQTAEP